MNSNIMFNCYQQGQYALVVLEWEKKYRHHPNPDYIFFWFVADSYFKKGDLRSAVQFALKAIANKEIDMRWEDYKFYFVLIITAYKQKNTIFYS